MKKAADIVTLLVLALNMLAGIGMIIVKKYSKGKQRRNTVTSTKIKIKSVRKYLYPL